MVRATAITPEPIASFRAVDVRGNETHTGGCAGVARFLNSATISLQIRMVAGFVEIAERKELFGCGG
jgi:hypothetical protein